MGTSTQGFEDRSRLITLAYRVLNTIIGPVAPKTDGELLSDLANAFIVHAREEVDKELEGLDRRRGKPTIKEPNYIEFE